MYPQTDKNMTTKTKQKLKKRLC